MNALLNILIGIRMLAARLFVWTPLVRLTRTPHDIQLSVLHKILRQNRDTTFGVRHGFSHINTYAEYCAAVDIHSYEDLRPYIDTQREESTAELTAERPVMFAQTSGTTAEPKYVPILPSTIQQYKRSQTVFSYAQYAAIPGVFDGTILCIVSPGTEGHLADGTPFGSMSGLIYESTPKPVRAKYCIPPQVFALSDYELKYYVIAALALVSRDVSIIATANPSSLLKLAEVIDGNAERLLSDIESGAISHDGPAHSDDGATPALPALPANPRRAAHLRKLLAEHGGLQFEHLWPDLRAVATWTSGSCRLLLPALRRQLGPAVRITEMGYLSSEFRGTVTVDIPGMRGIPTLDQNFFEFAERAAWENGERIFRTLDQIVEGSQYYIVVTTQNGLYRYFINDIVEVDGMFNATPCVRFVQKGKGVTNITGEKLYESHILQAIEQVTRTTQSLVTFFVLVADAADQRYRLYLEQAADTRDLAGDEALAGLVDQALGDINVEYSAKRRSGRLRPLVATVVATGTGERYKRHCVDSGQRESQFKVRHLQYAHECDFDFAQHAQQVSA